MESYDEVPDHNKQTNVEQYAILSAVLDHLRDAASGMDGKGCLYVGDWRNQATIIILHVYLTGSQYTLQMWGIDDRITAVFNREVELVNPVRTHVIELSDPDSLEKLITIASHYLAIPRILTPKRLVRFGGHKQK